MKVFLRRAPKIVVGSEFNVTYCGKIVQVKALSNSDHSLEDCYYPNVYVQFPGPGGGCGMKISAYWKKGVWEVLEPLHRMIAHPDEIGRSPHR